VKVPVGQGLASHPYRVLRVRRSVVSGFDCCKGEQGRRSVHREPHRPQGIRTSLKPGQHRYSINTVGDVVNVTEANTKKSPRQDFRGAVGVQGRGMCGEKRTRTCETLTAPDSGARHADSEPQQGTKSPGAILNSWKLARRVSHRDVANRPGNKVSRNLNSSVSG